MDIQEVDSKFITKECFDVQTFLLEGMGRVVIN